jgi:hypothetical protein
VRAPLRGFSAEEALSFVIRANEILPCLVRTQTILCGGLQRKPKRSAISSLTGANHIQRVVAARWPEPLSQPRLTRRSHP